MRSPEEIAREILSCAYGTSRTAQEDRVGDWIAAALRVERAEVERLRAVAERHRALVAAIEDGVPSGLWPHAVEAAMLASLDAGDGEEPPHA